VAVVAKVHLKEVNPTLMLVAKLMKILGVSTMSNELTKPLLQRQNFQEIGMIELLDLRQLDKVVGGSVAKIPGIHKVSDVTLKRGIVG